MMGVERRSVEEITMLIVDYFRDLFCSLNLMVQLMEAAMHEIHQMVTDELYTNLIAPFTKEEVTRSFFSMGPTKALDQMVFALFFFYQKHWEILGSKVVQAFLQI